MKDLRSSETTTEASQDFCPTIKSRAPSASQQRRKPNKTTKLTLPRAFNSKPANVMAMALTHSGFDDDFFAGFPLSALMTGNLRNNDGNAGNRGIPLDVKEVRA